MSRRSGKKVLVWVLGICMIFSTVGVVSAAKAKDIKGHWAESAITSWMDQSLAFGYEDGTFRPENTVNRQEITALINRSFGFVEPGTIQFSDVSQSDWSYADIAKAQKAGYVSGYPDGTFQPKHGLNRQEVAVIIAKLLGLNSPASADVYGDAKSIPDWSKGSVGGVTDSAIMTGYPDGTFRPLKSTTRAEAIAILNKALKIKSEQDPAGVLPGWTPSPTLVPGTPSSTSTPVPSSNPTATPVPTTVPTTAPTSPPSSGNPSTSTPIPTPGIPAQPVLVSATVPVSADVTISAPTAGVTAWLAPAGTTVFTAATNMTALVGNGTATTIIAPATPGDYHLFLVNAAGVSPASQGILTVQSVIVGPAAVNLGTAGNFVILSKTGISTVPGSVITGDIGVSPIDATAITGFSLIADATNQFATSTQVTGSVYAANYTSPTSSNLTTAISDLETAYTDAAGRAINYSELYVGDLSGKTLEAGVYKWSTKVLINGDVTLHGGPNDVFVFQISKGITQASGTKVILTGGAQAKNIFWQTAETVEIGTNAHIEGNIISMTNITMATNSSVKGRLLAQTAITLDQSTVTAP